MNYNDDNKDLQTVCVYVCMNILYMFVYVSFILYLSVFRFVSKETRM